MSKKILFLFGVLALFAGCAKQEEEIILTPDAGPGYLDVENDGYVVTLNAQPPAEGQKGIWRIYTGENGRFEDAEDPHTRFYGEPGETYLLGWEISQGDYYKAATINVSFRPLQPVIVTEISDTLKGNISLWAEAVPARFGATGRWQVTAGDNGRLLHSDSARTVFIGQPQQEYTLTWTLTYGSKEASATLTFITDSLRADAGEDHLDIVTYTPDDDPKYTGLEAFLPGGGHGSWQIIRGEGGRIYNTDNPHSAFMGMADTTYTLVWNVQVDEYSASDTVQLRFRGKWGVWVDPRDKQPYRYVRIGNLEWMAENFNYAAPWTEYARNFYYGQSARANILDGHPVDTEEERKFYGRLYNYYGAVEACPEGWRLPTLAEFRYLVTQLGGYLYFFDKLVVGGESGLDINFGGGMTYSYTYLQYRDNFYSQEQLGIYVTSNYDPVKFEYIQYIYFNTGSKGSKPASAFFHLASVRYVRDVK